MKRTAHAWHPLVQLNNVASYLLLSGWQWHTLLRPGSQLQPTTKVPLNLLPGQLIFWRYESDSLAFAIHASSSTDSVGE
jgi:hypothetical protein